MSFLSLFRSWYVPNAMATGFVERSKQVLREVFRRSVLPALGPGTSVCWDSQSGARRYLLTDDVMNLRKFQHNKLKTTYKVYGRKDLYFRSIEEKLTKNSPILQDELKLLIHLCDTKSDVEIVKRVIYRYHKENKNAATQVYRFGPLFMRLCYELNLEEPALELIKDQALYGFFSDSTSFDVLMDLLFTNENYERALEVLLEMKKQGIKFSRGTYLLAIAICYKLNDSKSCKICTTLLEDKQLRDNFLSRRAYYFLVVLALKQNDIGKAHTFFLQIMDTDSRIYNNIKILLQAASGDLEDIVQTLEEASKTTASPFVKKKEFCSHVLSTARGKLEDVPALCDRFEKVLTKLQSSGQIISSTLDDLLCQAPRKKRQQMQLLKPNIVSHRTQDSVLLDE